MAPPNLKPFYLGLAAIAVIGGGAIFFARGGGGGSTVRTANPVAGGDTAALPGYVLGNADAPIEIEEYADFQCPACQRFAVLTMPDVKSRLIATGQVRWRFRDFPLYSIHPKTAVAHEAAACSGEQGKFWEMHDQLFFNQTKWVETRNSARAIRDYAKTIGVDLGKYDECMDAGRFRARILASAKQGELRGVNSTPTLVIGSLMISEALSYDSLKAIITNLTSGKTKTS